jgi:hypothetical protein
MSQVKGNSLNDRLDNAAKARAETLAKLRAMPGPNDPATLKRQAEMKAIAEAREARAAERAAAKIREAQELAEKEAAAKLEAEARAVREAAEQAALEAAQKAARDERFAARKKRKG